MTNFEHAVNTSTKIDDSGINDTQIVMQQLTLYLKNLYQLRENMHELRHLDDTYEALQDEVRNCERDAAPYLVAEAVWSEDPTFYPLPQSVRNLVNAKHHMRDAEYTITEQKEMVLCSMKDLMATENYSRAQREIDEFIIYTEGLIAILTPDKAAWINMHQPALLREQMQLFAKGGDSLSEQKQAENHLLLLN